MKKYVKIAFAYAVAAMAFGVFYREFTKFNDFVGKTSLAVTHLHLFVLGSIVMLVLGLIDARYDISLHKLYKPTIILYNVALPYMVIMFTARGVLQVVSDSLSSGADGAVSGIAGIGHAAMGVAIVLLFIVLLKTDYGKKANENQNL